MLDTRSHRDRYPSPPGSEPVICTNAQLAELRAWLDREPSRIKFIVTGSVIVPGLRQMHAGTTASGVSVGEADNWQLAPRQRQRLLQMVAACRSAAVVLLSGDYHCAALARIELTGLAHKRVYALAAPPLYAPYPALNVHPLELTPDRRRFALAETIGLAPDLDARVHVHALPGMGYMDIAIVSEGAAPWLQVTTDITLLDAADAPVHKRHRLRFPL